MGLTPRSPPAGGGGPGGCGGAAGRAAAGAGGGELRGAPTGEGTGWRGAPRGARAASTHCAGAVGVRSKARCLPLPGALCTQPCGQAGVGLGARGLRTPPGLSHGSLFPHPTGGIPGIRARGIMDPRPGLFHQQHNEPPGAPCSSPAGPGWCPRAGEEQGCPCPVRSRVLPPVPFQGTVSVSPYPV